MVTLNSDDPAMFDCTLAGEYREVATRFGFDGSVMRRVALNAVDGSWAGPAEKDRLRRLIGEWWADSESL
jgi:adenosine deaminase